MSKSKPQLIVISVVGAYTNKERHLFSSDLTVKGLMGYAPTRIEIYKIGVVLRDLMNDHGTCLTSCFSVFDHFW